MDWCGSLLREPVPRLHTVHKTKADAAGGVSCADIKNSRSLYTAVLGCRHCPFTSASSWMSRLHDARQARVASYESFLSFSISVTGAVCVYRPLRAPSVPSRHVPPNRPRLRPASQPATGPAGGVAERDIPDDIVTGRPSRPLTARHTTQPHPSLPADAGRGPGMVLLTQPLQPLSLQRQYQQPGRLRHTNTRAGLAHDQGLGPATRLHQIHLHLRHAHQPVCQALATSKWRWGGAGRERGVS